MLQEKYVARVESFAAMQSLHTLDEKEALGARVLLPAVQRHEERHSAVRPLVKVCQVRSCPRGDFDH
jgi:hypothetical protein